MGLFDSLFGQVAQTIQNHSSADTPGPSYDPNPLLGSLQNLFGQHAANNNQDFSQQGYQQGDYDYSQNSGNVAPASQDPYGDPADQAAPGQGEIAPASQDPYGDPADQR